MKFFLGTLLLATSAVAQVVDQKCVSDMDAVWNSHEVSSCVREKLDQYIGLLEVPVTIKVSTNGRILSLDELRAHLLSGATVLANPSSRSSIYGGLQGVGINNMRIINGKSAANGYYLNLAAVSLTYVNQIGENTYFHVRYLMDLNLPFSKMYSTNILFDTQAYDAFKAARCPGCISRDESGVKSGLTVPNMAMEVAFNIKNFRIAMDGKVSYFSRKIMKYTAGSSEIRGNITGNQKTIGLEVSKNLKFNRGLRFQVYARAELNQLKDKNNFEHVRYSPYGGVATGYYQESNTERSTTPYIGVGLRFNLNLKNSGR